MAPNDKEPYRFLLSLLLRAAGKTAGKRAGVAVWPPESFMYLLPPFQHPHPSALQTALMSQRRKVRWGEDSQSLLLLPPAQLAKTSKQVTHEINKQ